MSLPTDTSQHQVKILGATAGGFRVGGYGVVFGGNDMVGDYFTADTDFWFDRLTECPMVLYQHGGDGMMKRTVVGQVVAKRVDNVGLWIEAQITTSKKYVDAIRALVEKGVLGWSSGAVGYLVDRVKTGDRQWLKSWPIAEFSLTPTPAEPRTLGVRAVKALAGVDAGVAGLLDADDLEDGRAGAPQEERMPTVDALPDSAFAYVEPGELDAERKTVPRARRHFPHHGADGAVDPGLLAEAIRDAAASAHAAKALPHLLREQVGAGDADDPVWRTGAPADLLVLAHRLTALAVEAAEEQKALARLGDDVKGGRVLRAGLRKSLGDLIDELGALRQSAEHADRDTDERAALEIRKRRLALIGVG